MEEGKGAFPFTLSLFSYVFSVLHLYRSYKITTIYAIFNLKIRISTQIVSINKRDNLNKIF